MPVPSRRFNLVELTQMGGGFLAKEQLDLMQARLAHGALLFQPSICKPRHVALRELDYLRDLGLDVPDWHSAKNTKRQPVLHHHSTASIRQTMARGKAAPQQGGKVGNAMKLLRAVKSKANGSGRTYTSKYRGVHQTFPTKRWEAQFRRNGKPTSLGCFDHEEEAARAYDKMMLWCELHNAAGVKSGITNFDPTEYEKEFAWLQAISQDELIETLRSEGRRQAAHRMMRQKREGQVEQSEDEDAPAPAPQAYHQPPLFGGHGMAAAQPAALAAASGTQPLPYKPDTVSALMQQQAAAAAAGLGMTAALGMGVQGVGVGMQGMGGQGVQAVGMQGVQMRAAELAMAEAAAAGGGAEAASIPVVAPHVAGGVGPLTALPASLGGAPAPEGGPTA
ncbi:hypothetical protein HYH03_012159 [Edaphochlamys debaryana]|uniref:AP2/ERF domain-containing protein n=1 Tax=Edaphochlamys debaryana TaxID=47281 RepID=A0A836BUT1_9CHLO|nr:hypothetical protein HYH03_012159 [Edaphochlamys debaryana]|eukprot:KAG2489327.1 hypothetical protein HYH03_012159 [Edaphochlamys debaryana]